MAAIPKKINKPGGENGAESLIEGVRGELRKMFNDDVIGNSKFDRIFVDC